MKLDWELEKRGQQVFGAEVAAGFWGSLEAGMGALRGTLRKEKAVSQSVLEALP